MEIKVSRANDHIDKANNYTKESDLTQ